MTPTRRNEEIEGRSYKEYAYSPVPESSSSAVYESTTNPKQSILFRAGIHDYEELNGARRKWRAKDMEKGSTVLQYLAAAAGNLCTLATGAMLGWTSPTFPKLEKVPVADDNPLGEPISSDQSSWIGSLVALGAMFGCFLAGYLAEKWGRKRTLLFSVVPFTIGWVLIGTARSVVQLYIARLIFGVALAFPFTVLPMYVGEIAETSVRGALGSFLQLFITFGLLFAYAVGPYVSYTVFWIVCATLPIIFFLCFMTMPESPYFLLRQGEREDAIAALARLRGKTRASVQKEADEMQASVEEAFRNQASISDLFSEKANFKALLLTCALAGFQQLTGINVVLFYMENIFIAAEVTAFSTSVATIIVAIVQVLASAVTPVVVDRLGRKLLLILSGVGEIVTLGALGLYFYLQKSNSADGLSWLPVMSLVVFIATYCVGWGPLPWTVMGEMFASNVKSKASSITVCICWLLAFFITKFSSNLNETFGMYTLFWCFSVCCVVSVLFTIFLLPETKGKSLQEIQDELNGIKPSIPEFSGSMKH